MAFLWDIKWNDHKQGVQDNTTLTAAELSAFKYKLENEYKTISQIYSNRLSYGLDSSGTEEYLEFLWFYLFWVEVNYDIIANAPDATHKTSE